MADAFDASELHWPLADRLHEEAAPVNLRQGFARLRDALRAELELVLNTRRPRLRLPMEARELQRSLVAFGLPDLAGGVLAGENDAEDFRRAVEEAIRLFMPALGAPKVELADPGQMGACLRLRISATLHCGPERRPLAFESTLTPDARRFHVSDGGDG